MKCTISTPGQLVVLTLTADPSLNSSNLNRTDLLLNHVISSPVSLIIIDLNSLSVLSPVGTWTLFQVVHKAKEHGKSVYLYNVHPAIQSYLTNAGICELAIVIYTKHELDKVFQGKYRLSEALPKSVGMDSSFNESPALTTESLRI
ncbi:MAG: STAS domain-containing protein [Nitrospirales bacterium]|nr:STAS domain-containing protein [Nitrospirales bacterium]